MIPVCVFAGVVIVGDCETLGDKVADRFHRLRQPEVQHLDRAVTPHLDICGLQIAVNDALLVRGLECLGDLLRDRQCLVEWNRSPAMRCDRSSPSTSSITRAVMPPPLQARRWPRCSGDSATPASWLHARSDEPISVVRERLGQDFDRDIAIQLRVAGPEDLAHAAFAYAGDNFVDTETGTGGKGQG